MPFAATGLPWVSPSPNIPSPRDGARLSGDVPARGNEPLRRPRDDAPLRDLRRALARGRPVRRRAERRGPARRRASCPTHFRPMFDKHAGETCGGALLQVTDASGLPLLRDGAARSSRSRAGAAPREFRWRTEPYEFDPRPAIDLLTGSPRFRELVDAGARTRAARSRRHAAGARGVSRAARALPPLSGPPAGRRRVRRRAQLGQDDPARRSRAASRRRAASPSGRSSTLPRRRGRRAGQGLAPPRRAPAPRVAGVRHAGPDDRRGGSAREEPLDELLAREFSDCDLVLVEGYKALPIPKIEVTRAARSRGPPVAASARARLRLRRRTDGVPTISFERPEADRRDRAARSPGSGRARR